MADLVCYSYQPGGSSGFSKTKDPLSNGAVCLRDAALMQPLGVSVISPVSVSRLLTPLR